MLIVVLMLAAVGCEGRLKATDSDVALVAVGNTSVPKIDAGVVFADRSGYLCLPLQRVGLEARAEVVSLSSSCECVQPRLVEYKVLGEATARGVLLEFVAEPTSGESSGTSNVTADLSVIIEATLADGAKHTFTVDLLHTVIAEEALR